MNIKSIFTATILAALFAGTSAIAGDNDHFAVSDSVTASGKVNFQSPTAEPAYVFEDSNK